MLYSNGNKKVGNDTYIINLNTATTCPAKDICLVRKDCYAWCNERMRPVVYAYRQRQEELWEYMPAEYYIKELIRIKKDSVKYVRWQESGDFRNQSDVNKISYICQELKDYYQCYTYTSRYDLDYSEKSKNLVINGSSFMVDNAFIALDRLAYEKVMESEEGAACCPGDCRGCTLCKVARGIEIYIAKTGRYNGN